jgi:hypothetical protein
MVPARERAGSGVMTGGFPDGTTPMARHRFGRGLEPVYFDFLGERFELQVTRDEFGFAFFGQSRGEGVGEAEWMAGLPVFSLAGSKRFSTSATVPGGNRSRLKVFESARRSARSWGECYRNKALGGPANAMPWEEGKVLDGMGRVCERERIGAAGVLHRRSEVDGRGFSGSNYANAPASIHGIHQKNESRPSRSAPQLDKTNIPLLFFEHYFRKYSLFRHFPSGGLSPKWLPY